METHCQFTTLTFSTLCSRQSSRSDTVETPTLAPSPPVPLPLPLPPLPLKPLLEDRSHCTTPTDLDSPLARSVTEQDHGSMLRQPQLLQTQHHLQPATPAPQLLLFCLFRLFSPPWVSCFSKNEPVFVDLCEFITCVARYDAGCVSAFGSPKLVLAAVFPKSSFLRVLRCEQFCFCQLVWQLSLHSNSVQTLESQTIQTSM